MSKKSKCLCTDIKEAAKKAGIDPLTMPFKPEDLNIIASDYGSFSDWCSAEETVSGRYNRRVCLTVAERRGGKPFKYLLLPEGQWVY